jgi:hypothetical protein
MIISCATENDVLKPASGKTETAEIIISTDKDDAEELYFSDIYISKDESNYIAYSATSDTGATGGDGGSGRSFINSSIIGSDSLIGISMTDENTLISSDRQGNISIYKKNNDKLKLSKKIKVKTENELTFDAFCADKTFICLFSGLTDSLYFFPIPRKKSPSLILKLYTEDTSFSREITDIDMKAGYLYLLDTENRVSIIDFVKRKFETDTYLKSSHSLRSLAVIQDDESSSLAVSSPGSREVYIYPLSERYLMTEKKGFIKTSGITSFNYGSHVLVSETGDIIYALESHLIDLSEHTKGEMRITGKLNPDYPVDGGPELIMVSEVRR